jgi:hypothetical protein
VGLFSGERIGIAVDGNERIGPSGKGVEHGWDVSGPVWTATVVLVNRGWGFESPLRLGVFAGHRLARSSQPEVRGPSMSQLSPL